MDRILEKLYNDYLKYGILSRDTDLKTFSSASEEIKETLYRQGISKGVLSSSTDLDLFKSAWDVKKKDTSEPTLVEEPMVSGLETGSLEPSEEEARLYSLKTKFDSGKFTKEERDAYDKFKQEGVIDPSLLPEEDDESEASKEFKSSGLRLLSGVSRIPTAFAEQAMTVVQEFNPELKSYLSSLDPDQREDFISRVASVGTPLVSPDVTKVSRELAEEAEEIEKTIKQYETGITEDIFSENFFRGLNRLGNKAVGSIPSLIAAVAPGGIALVGGGSFASKSKELQEKGYDLGLRTSINAIGSGVAEGVFETFTRKLIPKNLLKKITGESKEKALVTIKNLFQSAAKGFGIEGSSETATLLAQEALDKYVSQDEEAFTNFISEALDTFIIGGVVGAPLGTLNPAVGLYAQGKQKKKLKKLVDESKYASLEEAFETKGDGSVFEAELTDIMFSPNSGLILEATLKSKVKNNEISQESADAITSNYKRIESSLKSFKGLDLSYDQKVKTLKLLDEKAYLNNIISGKDENLVTGEKEKIEQINSELSELSKNKGKKESETDVTRKEAIEFAQSQGVKNPSEGLIFKIQKNLKDAIQKSSTEKVDVQEPTPDSGEVGERDTKQVKPTEEAATEEGRVAEEEKVPTQKIGEALEDTGVFIMDGEKGSVTTIGQTIVFETKDKIKDLGNVEELSGVDISDFGIEKEAELDISVEEDFSVNMDSQKLVNNYSDPQAAVNLDSEGKVVSVNLETESGQKRTIRGQRAEEIAYQYLQRKFENEATDEQIQRANEQAEKLADSERETVEVAQQEKTRSVKERSKVDPEKTTYTLPESPRERNKDFDIIDNRSEAQGLEIDEDGNGRWYVVNNKTGSLVATRTKKEATENKRNPDWDYGEGAPLLVQPKKAPETKVSEKVEKPKKAPKKVYKPSVPSSGLSAGKIGLQKQVEKAKKALSGLPKKVNIIIVESNEEYVDRFGDDSRAIYARDGNIYINLANAIDSTVPHEVFHAILLSKGFSDLEARRLTKKMLESVEKSGALSEDQIQKYREFGELYISTETDALNRLKEDGVANPTKAQIEKKLEDMLKKDPIYEESLAEIFASLSEDYSMLDSKTQSVIVRFINRLAKRFGLGQIIKPKPTNNEVIQLLKTLAVKVGEGEVITEQDLSDIEIGAKVSNPVKSLRKMKIGAFDVQYIQEDRLNEMIENNEVGVEENLSFINRKTVAVTSPDDMVAGILSIFDDNGNLIKIFEGDGGLFFITKYGDVWASSEKAANQFIKIINESVRINGGTGYLLLEKGTDTKLLSSTQGVEAGLSILKKMIENNLISLSDVRKSISTSIRKEEANLKGKNKLYKSAKIDLIGSSKETISKIEKQFKDSTLSTFNTRGNIMKVMISQLGQSKSASKNAEQILSFFGYDGDKKEIGASSKTKTKVGMPELFSNLISENIVKGLKTSSVYAVVEVNGKVKTEPIKGGHPSYSSHIVMEDKSKKPKLILLKERELSRETLMENEVRYGGPVNRPVSSVTVNRPSSDKLSVVDNLKLEKPLQDQIGLSSEIVTDYNEVDELSSRNQVRKQAFGKVDPKFVKNNKIKNDDYIMSAALSTDNSFGFLGFDKKLTSMSGEDAINKEINRRLDEIENNAKNTNEYFLQEFTTRFIEDGLERAETQSIKDTYEAMLDGNKQVLDAQIDHIQQQQRNSLMGSINYLKEQQEYSPAFKYLMLGLVLRGNTSGDIIIRNDEGDVVKTIPGTKVKRGKKTVGNHEVLSPLVLPDVYSSLNNGSEKHPMVLIKENSDKEFINKRRTEEIIKGRVYKEVPEGTWVRFKESNSKKDIEELKELSYKVVKFFDKKSDAWCTASGMADTYLPKGDFYLFLDKNLDPKITVRYEGDQIVELKGTGSGQQMLESENILARKTVPEMPNGGGYLYQIDTTDLYYAMKKGKDLSRNQLKIYFQNLNRDLETYNYEKKQEYKKLKKEYLEKNKKAAVDFGLYDDIVSDTYGLTELKENTLYLDGFDFSSNRVPDNFIIPDGVTINGDIDLSISNLPEGFRIGRNVTINGSFDIEDSKLPEGFTIPKDVTFNGRVSLEDSEIPKGFKIEDGVTFNDSISFSRATLPKGFKIEEGVTFNGDVDFSETTLPEGFKIEEGVTFNGIVSFNGATLPKGFKIEKGVTFDGNVSFREAKLPEGFTIPKGTTFNGIVSFFYTTLPEGFTIPDGVTFNGDVDFSDTTLPKGFTIPDGVTFNGGVDFSRATLPEGFKIPDGVTFDRLVSFSGATLPEGFKIGEGVTFNGFVDFSDTTLPKGFTIPDGVTFNGGVSFSDTTLPKGFTIPDGVTFNGGVIFSDTTLPKGFTIPDGVTFNGGVSFSDTTLPEGFKIGEGVTFNGGVSFIDATLPEGFTIPDGVTFNGDVDFSGSTLSDGSPFYFDSSERSIRRQAIVPAGNRLFSNPLDEAKSIAERVSKITGIKVSKFEKIRKLDKERAKRIAEVYDKQESNPKNAKVKKAYSALIKETLIQYKEILKSGYNLELSGQEYKNSSDMISDLRDNKNMRVFSTEEGFGFEGVTDKLRKENPMLARTNFKDKNGKPLLINDIFRFVHDFFGHAKEGNSFGPLGEENAWAIHSEMYSLMARRALTTETRGQNSWVNFSGVNDEAFALRDEARALRRGGKIKEAEEKSKEVYEKMRFGEQKVMLMPEEFVLLDSEKPVRKQISKKESNLTPEQYDLVRTDKFKNWFGDWESDPENASKIVDENGEPRVVYHGSKQVFEEFDPKKMATETIRSQQGPGYYFTNREKEAGSYGKVISAFMSVKNPFILYQSKRRGKDISVQQTIDILSKGDYKWFFDSNLEFQTSTKGKGFSRKKLIKLYAEQLHKDGDKAILKNVKRAYTPESYQKLIDNVSETLGVDGVIEEVTNRTDVYVAYQPTQVKMADGSNVTFDPMSRSIRKQKNKDAKEVKEGFDKVNKDIKKKISNINIPEDDEAYQKAYTEINQQGSKEKYKLLRSAFEDINSRLKSGGLTQNEANEQKFELSQELIPRDKNGKISWEDSKIGRGDSAITNRNEKVQNAAQDYFDGKISYGRYLEILENETPILPIVEFFGAATESQIKLAIGKKGESKIDVKIDEGKQVGLRLDIPAYKDKNIWVVSIHEHQKNGGKAIGYTNVARIKGYIDDNSAKPKVKFKSYPMAALNISKGKNKATIARIEGVWSPLKGKTSEGRGKTAMDIVDKILDLKNPDKSWVQVGMNPFRHSFFYNRANGMPLVSADEVIQIGGLVYAKNAVETTPEDPSFEFNLKDGSVRRFQKNRDKDIKRQDEALKKAERLDEEGKKELRDNLKSWWSAFSRTSLSRSWFDRQVDFKKLMSKFNNKAYQEALNKVITRAGATGWANRRFEKARKEIYGNLSLSQIKALNHLLRARRIVAITESRMAKGMELYEANISYDEAYDLIDALRRRSDFKELKESAEKYFEVTKENLKRLYKSGRISLSTYEELKNIDYLPIKTLKYLIKEKNLSQQEMNDMALSNGMSGADIKRLSDSNVENTLLDSEWLLQMTINTTENRAFKNEMVRAFDNAIKKSSPEEKEIIEEYVKPNKVISKDKQGRPIFFYDQNQLPLGFKKVNFFIDGEYSYLVMDSMYADQLMDFKSMDVGDTGVSKTIVDAITGRGLLRFFATGANVAFVFGNVPIDFANILLNTDVYEGHNLKKGGMLTAGARLAKDFIRLSFNKIINSKGYNDLYDEYASHGGALDWLSVDGLKVSLFGEKIENAKTITGKSLNAIGRFLSYAGQTSEIGFRLAVYERYKNNAIKEFKNKNNREPNKEELDLIMFDAAREARETIDFSQGGNIAKKLDKFSPYLNASLQGFRKTANYAEKNPAKFENKTVQTMVWTGMIASGGLAIAISALKNMFPEEDEEEIRKRLKDQLDSVHDYEASNYLRIYYGINEEGNLKYLRIKKHPGFGFAMTLSEQLVYNSVLGEPIYSQGDVIKRSAMNVLPVDPSGSGILSRISPTVSGAVSYYGNKDTFTNQEIFRKPTGKNVAEWAEGIEDERIPEMYRKLAPAVGLSPARTKVFIEKVITSPSTNPLIGLLYASSDGLFNIANKNNSSSKAFNEGLSKMGEAFKGKIVRTTNPEVLQYKKIDRIEEEQIEIETEIYRKEQEVYSKIRKSKDKKLSKNDIKEIIKERFNEEDWKKYYKKYSRYNENMDNIDRTILDIIYTSVPESQAMKLNQYFGSNINEEELKIISATEKMAGRGLSKKAIQIYKSKYRKRLKN